MNHPALALLALRVHLVRLIQRPTACSGSFCGNPRQEWTTFEYCVDRGLSRACVAFNRERSLEAAERAAVSVARQRPGGPPPVIQPSDGWFWDAVARETKTTFETQRARFGTRGNAPGEAFDARAAYDSVRAACRMRGYPPKTLRALLELERAHVARECAR